MASEIVLLSSEDEEDRGCYGSSRPISKQPSSALNLSDLSDNELINMGAGSSISPPRHRKSPSCAAKVGIPTSNAERFLDEDEAEIEYSFTRFSQLNKPAAKAVGKKTAATSKESRLEKAAKAKQDKAAKAAENAINKATKAQEKAKEKAMKAAESANKKANNLGDCIQHLKAFIDSTLLNLLPGSGNILTQLQEAGIKHSVTSNPVPCSVYWTREKMEYYVDDSAEVRSRSTTTQEDDMILILTAEEFAALAQGRLHPSAAGGCYNYANDVLRKLSKKSLTLIVYGLNEYFRLQNLKDKQRFRQHCTGKASNKGGSTQDDDTVTPAQMEELKVRFTLQTECSIWPVETTEELGKTIARFSKSVAERPFKQERFEQRFDFYAPEVSGGVKVNKDGLGLTRLWQQQIMQFPLVALETSQAIVSQYPTPQALLDAYRASKDEKEASLLLQDIPVRRHAGPLSSSRKVGPELSKRVHKFMTSKDGAEIL